VALVAVGWTVVALACSSPQPFAPPRSGGVAIDGRTVVWTTTVASIGAVRYGRRPGEYLTVAYPDAAARADKKFVTSHRVPLLGVATGDTAYLQLLDVGLDGVVSVSAETTVVLPTLPAPAPLLSWTMIDVGFGDSHLLTMPTSGARILVDAGERRDADNVARYLEETAIDRLDAVMLTHIHEDHIGGMVGRSGTTDDGVLAQVEVGRFLDTPNHSGARAAYQEVLAVLAARDIPRVVVAAGESDATNAALAWDGAVRTEVLHAGDGRATGGESENDWINNDSIVLRLSYGQVDLVMGGDAESAVETRLLRLGRSLDSEVLKVHHHGVNDASQPAFLTAVNPRVGMIPVSAYESDAGTLPTTAVLQRLRERRVDVYASDRAEPLGIALHGDAGHHVTVCTDGRSYEVSVQRSNSHHYRAAQPLADQRTPARTGRGGRR
jgi:beta-lactamase superfamily II metal-dependent hydrolase